MFWLNTFGCFALLLTSEPDTLDFGKLTFGSPLQTRKAVVKNTAGKVFYFKFLQIFQTKDSLFVLNNKLPVKMAMFSDNNLEISFKADLAQVGKDSADLYLYDESKADTVLVHLKAEITQPEPKFYELTIPDLTAKTGSYIDIPFILTRFTPDDRITGFNASIEFNSTILTTANPEEKGRFEFGKQIVAISKKLSSQGLHERDTIFVLKGVTMLGNAQKTDINLTDFKWVGETSITNFHYSKNSGSVLLTDIFFDNGIPRLATKVTDQLVIQSPLDVVKNDFEIEISYVNYAQLKIIDILGNQIVNFPNQTPFHRDYASEKIQVSRQGFTNPGIYIVVLSSATQVVSKLLIIE